MAGLPYPAWERFGIWIVIGLVIYVAYGYRHSKLRLRSCAGWHCFEAPGSRQFLRPSGRNCERNLSVNGARNRLQLGIGRPAGRPAVAPCRTTGLPSGAPGSTTSRTSTSISPGTSWWSSPACPAPGSRRWPSTRSTPRASGATWSRCRPTRGSSSSRWRSRTWTSSRACRRPSRSSRRPPAPTRAPRSAPSPRSTTTCGCSSPTSACRTARTAAARSPRSRSSASWIW